MPGVMRFNGPVLGSSKIEKMAAIMGVKPSVEALADAITGMNERIGIPAGLKAMGVTEDRFEAIADGALGDHCHMTTPRQPSTAEYLQLIEGAYGA
jgi:alcohol dehydrogenase class IV